MLDTIFYTLIEYILCIIHNDTIILYLYFIHSYIDTYFILFHLILAYISFFFYLCGIL